MGNYPPSTWVAIVYAIVPAIFVIIFWLKYKWIRKWFGNWSHGEFTAPAKRYSLLMLHGLGWLALNGLVMGLLLALCQSVARNNEVLPAIVTALVIPASAYGYWWIVKFFKTKKGATARECAFEVAYGVLAFAAWTAIVVIGFYAVLLAIALVVVYGVFKLWFFSMSSEEITVKSGGFFGGTKKVQATRNIDGSYTDLEGNTYR